MIKMFNATTADTLSHICRNSFIKFMIPFISAVSLCSAKQHRYKRRIWCGASPQNGRYAFAYLP
ncbi:MAG: hypothetical protein ACLS48_01220 [[Eubacterium] siraeum]